MKEKQLTSNKPKLKIDSRKYRRTKSQEHLEWERKQDNFLQFRSNNKLTYQQKQNQKNYFVLIIKKGSEEFEEVKIAHNTGMSVVKAMLCNKLHMENGTVYFTSIDKDYNFDYRLHEEIGTLTTDKRLELRLISKVDQDKIQEGKLSSYFIYDCLSVGGFSKVFPLRSKKSGDFYAAKFVDKCDEDPDKFRELIYNQKYINELLDYPMLVKMHEFIETKDFYIFVLDYCPSGELFCLMKQNRDMTEEQAKFFFIETILGIDYMHKKSIIYRDIKPENILLDKNGHIKIADFGLAKIMREKSTSYCGSLEYMAPEIVLGSEHSFGVDHYCLGSLLYEMMVGCPPFYNPSFNPNQTKYHIVNSDVKFPSRRGYSDNLIDFITKLLDKNPKTRLGSMGGIKEILSHPWVGKFDRKLYQNHRIDPPIRRPLDQNNFETASLPKQAIFATMIKIEAELDSEKGQNKLSMKKGKLTNVVQISRKRLKTNEIAQNGRIAVKSPRQSKEKQILQKRKKSILEGDITQQNSKSIFKNPSRSLHISPLEKTKKSLSKLRQYSRSIKADNNVQFSCSNLNFLKNLVGNQSKIEKKKMRKSMENCHILEKGNQMRKSQNFDKQNQFKNLKFKFELKSKEMKKSEQGMQRDTYAQRRTKQCPKQEQKSKINRALNKAIFSSLMK